MAEKTREVDAGGDSVRGDLPLSAATSLAKFSSLAQPLEMSEIVAIYFAASWCPLSKPATEAIVRSFSGKNDVLLTAEDIRDHLAFHARKNSGNKRLSLVYVSSDTSEDEMSRYGSGDWIRVPYHSDERKLLKRHFQTCAEDEAKPLNVNRRYGIPRLIVLDSGTHGILSTDGVDDVLKKGSDALEGWLQLRNIAKVINQGEPSAVI